MELAGVSLAGVGAAGVGPTSIRTAWVGAAGVSPAGIEPMRLDVVAFVLATTGLSALLGLFVQEPLFVRHLSSFRSTAGVRHPTT